MNTGWQAQTAQQTMSSVFRNGLASEWALAYLSVECAVGCTSEPHDGALAPEPKCARNKQIRPCKRQEASQRLPSYGIAARQAIVAARSFSYNTLARWWPVQLKTPVGVIGADSASLTLDVGSARTLTTQMRNDRDLNENMGTWCVLAHSPRRCYGD